jgi:hypothetical protein
VPPPYTTSDGLTTVNITGPLGPSVPLVVLLHGLGGDEMHMTDPVNGVQVGQVMFDRSAGFPVFRDGGWHAVPPVIPADGFDIDPLLTSVTSWRQALNDAGLPTLSYLQAQPSGVLAPNVAQLILIAQDILSSPRHPELASMRLAFVAHSRGGVVLRQFLAGATVNPAFMSRVVAAITLHSPHQGSGLANAAVSVDAAAAQVQSVFSALGLPAPGFLAWIRSQLGSPAIAEIRVGSSTLATLAALEPTAPVPGPEWHTFGGAGTHFTRVRAHLISPDSGIPIFFPLLPFPLFHWTTIATQIGVAPDPASFLPIPVPIVAELQAALTVLTTITPELAHGSGDLLTADARARLPFAVSHTTNALNHAEALYNPTLQAQVLTILRRFVTSPPSPPTPPVGVPDVREMRVAPAVAAVRAAGLVPTLSGSNTAQSWVGSQSPAAGTLLAVGSQVALVLRTGPIP